ncbi:MAG: replication initiation factor domain-containing protein [Lachnospiraceae bacterium]|nr:replication initiation factor domain-containing protein [Lachnospiraceae bacterium]
MDSRVAENLVLYDWLSFTSKVHSPEDLIAALGLTHVPWTETKGARGYRDRKYFSCISIHYNGRADMGVWVEMSGQGCRTFETLSTLSKDDKERWVKLFSFISSQGLKITRLDVAYDDHTGILDMGAIAQDTQTGMYISRSTYWETILSSKGSTVYIGSPQSKVLIRIYDKAAERGAVDQHWIRVELQLRDDRASQFSKIDLPIGQAFAGVLLNYLRYIQVPDVFDQNKWRWPMTDYWCNLISDAEKISIYQAPGMEYNEERCRRFVVNQAGNAIDACIQMYGLEEFANMIKNRETAPNPKYEEIVKRHRFEVLAARVMKYFGN